MSLEQERLLIQFDEDETIGLLFTSEIGFAGYNVRPVDNKEWVGVAERWGLVVDAPYEPIPIMVDEQMIVRVLEAEPHDDWIDCEIVKSEYSEFEDMLCRIPKNAITIIQHMTK